MSSPIHAQYNIIAAAAIRDVIAGFAEDNVVAILTNDGVITRPPAQFIITGPTKYYVGTTARIDAIITIIPTKEYRCRPGPE